MKLQINETLAIQIVPTLKLIENLEEAYGPLGGVLQEIKAQKLTLENQKKIILIAAAQTGDVMDNQMFNNLIAQKGSLAVTDIAVKILALCIAGEEGIKEFYQEIPSLGKP